MKETSASHIAAAMGRKGVSSKSAATDLVASKSMCLERDIKICEEEVFNRSFTDNSIVKICMLKGQGFSQQLAEDMVVSDRFTDLIKMLEEKVDLDDFEEPEFQFRHQKK